MTDVKRLVVVRHSKTEAHAATDHARTLTERGSHDARALGQWLDEHDIEPDAVLVSSAARARQTAALIVDELGGVPEPVVVDDLYGAGPEDVVEICRAELDESVECAVVVGHNPTMAVLVSELIGPDDEAGDAGPDLGHFPTSAAAVVEVTGPWASLELGAGTLAHLYRP